MELFHQGLSDHVIEVINLMCPHQETQLLLVRVIDARCLSNHGCAQTSQDVPMWDSPHLSYSKDPMNRGTISAKIFADPWGGHVGASLALMAHQCGNPTSQGGIFKAPVSLFKGTGQKYLAVFSIHIVFIVFRMFWGTIIRSKKWRRSLSTNFSPSKSICSSLTCNFIAPIPPKCTKLRFQGRS